MNSHFARPVSKNACVGISNFRQSGQKTLVKQNVLTIIPSIADESWRYAWQLSRRPTIERAGYLQLSVSQRGRNESSRFDTPVCRSRVLPISKLGLALHSISCNVLQTFSSVGYLPVHVPQRSRIDAESLEQEHVGSAFPGRLV